MIDFAPTIERVIQDEGNHHHINLPALEYTQQYIEAQVATFPSWIAAYEALSRYAAKYPMHPLVSCLKMDPNATGCNCPQDELFDRIEDFLIGKRDFQMGHAPYKWKRQ